MHSPRLASAVLMLAGTVAVAACDSTDQAPCGEVIGLSDSVDVAVGARTTVDLATLFAESGPSAQYSATWEQAAGTPIATFEVTGSELVVTGTQTGTRNLRVSARANCGVAAVATIVVRVLPEGTSCNVVPTANPTDVVHLAVGGVAVLIPLFGDDGLFSGAFVATSPVEVDGPGDMVEVTVVASPVRSVRLVPQSIAGTAVVRVSANDFCNRRISTDVSVEIVDSPTCAVGHDPASVDYFPLSPGLRWRYHVRRVYSAPMGSSDLPGEETWDVVAESPCHGGTRSYEVDVQGTGSGATGWMIFEVAGDRVRLVSRPTAPLGIPDLYVGWNPQRFYPPTTPDTVVTDPYPGVPLGPSWWLRRDTGLIHFNYSVHCGAACFRSFSMRLLEGPSIVAADQSVTQVYHRD